MNRYVIVENFTVVKKKQLHYKIPPIAQVFFVMLKQKKIIPFEGVKPAVTPTSPYFIFPFCLPLDCSLMKVFFKAIEALLSHTELYSYESLPPECLDYYSTQVLPLLQRFEVSHSFIPFSSLPSLSLSLSCS